MGIRDRIEIVHFFFFSPVFRQKEIIAYKFYTVKFYIFDSKYCIVEWLRHPSRNHEVWDSNLGHSKIILLPSYGVVPGSIPGLDFNFWNFLFGAMLFLSKKFGVQFSEEKVCAETKWRYLGPWSSNPKIEGNKVPLFVKNKGTLFPSIFWFGPHGPRYRHILFLEVAKKFWTWRV